MALLYTLPNGFKIYGGRLNPDEEDEIYRRIGSGPKVVFRSHRSAPEVSLGNLLNDDSGTETPKEGAAKIIEPDDQ